MNETVSPIRQKQDNSTTPVSNQQQLLGTSIMEQLPGQVTVQRETYESMVTATLDASRGITTTVRTPLAYVNSMAETIMSQAGFSIHASFLPKKNHIDLTHVITEDMGIALGTALKQILQQKQAEGINQQGSNVSGKNIKMLECNVFIGMNVEGRKEFQLITPKADDEVHRFIEWDVEDTTSDHLKSILNGLSEGLMAEITIYPLSGSDPHHIWEAVFRGVGCAIRHIRKNPVHPQTKLASQNGKSGFKIVEQTLNIVTSLERPELLVSVESAPRRKYELDTGSHFINHMLEHIAWNSGLNVDVTAHNLPPYEIGKTLGVAISRSELGSTGIDMGIIDEASAIICIDRNEKPGLKFCKFESTIQREEILAGIEQDTRRVDLDDFFQAIAQSMGASINIFVLREHNSEHLWNQINEAFAATLKQVFKENTYLAGTTSGVKGIN